MKRSLSIILLFLLSMILIACSNPTPEDVSISLKPSVDTIEINSEYKDPGAMAKAFGFPVSYEVTENTVDTTKTGVYQITYQVNYQGIIKTVVRKIQIIDSIEPLATLLPGIDTISLGDTWEDAGIEATDNSLSELTINITGNVNTEVAGEYIITYLVTDSSGNETTVFRYVNVVEQIGKLS